MTKRQAEIIQAIVNEYVQSGQPVASQILVEKFKMHISSATVRKEMSVLEQMGYLMSPHTSAGRVPTDTAIQLYVNELIHFFQITINEKSRLDELYRQAHLHLDQLMQATAQMLAATSNAAGIVLAPIAKNSIISRVELVLIHENQILMVMVSGSGSVFQKRLQLEKSVSQEELYKVSRFLNQHFKGYELSDVQGRGLEFLMDDAGSLSEDLTNIIMTVAQSMVYSPPEQQVFIEGGNNLYRQLVETMGEKKLAEQLIHRLEDKQFLCDLLNRMKDSNQVRAQIGLEIDGEIYKGVTLLAKSYSVGGRSLGALGVIGTSRMPYDKIIPTISYISQLLAKVAREHSELDSADEIVCIDLEQGKQSHMVQFQRINEKN